MSGFVITTDPVAEPLSVQETKDFLRVDSSDEDALIASLIVAAREVCETKTNRKFVTQTMRYTMDGWPDGSAIEMPRPFNSTTASPVVQYFASSGGSALTLGSTTYIVDTDSLPGRIVLKDDQTWPTLDLRAANGVQITAELGFGGQGDVPENIRSAMRHLVGHWYTNREAVIVGTISGPLEMSVDAMLSPYVVPFVP